MTWNTDERGVSTSRPVELYTIQTPATIIRLTSHNEDVSFGGNNYVATPQLSRTAIPNFSVSVDQEVTFELPVEHAFTRTMIGQVPPRDVSLTITRYQPISGLAIQIWQGYITVSSVEGRTASFRVPSALDDLLDSDIPSWAASRTCQNVLFDVNCKVSKAAYTYLSSLTELSGRTIKVGNAFPANFEKWFVSGNIKHLPTGEYRSILSHSVGGSDTLLKLNLPLPGSAILGDQVELYAGCSHIVDNAQGCGPKFGNVYNFGGHPHLPVSNPFTASYYGAIKITES